ncbi:YceI family protein [Sphingobacterium sp. LRF_L2]|uniref:YceI family protein n=1 Tax=Sphingobacterium sp. LRF_L2 TaxID=3369421 RepID=UPI003F6186C6
MKKTISILVLSLVLILSSFTISWYTLWKIQENDYVIKFETSKASGTIKGLEGKILFDKQQLSTADIDVSVDVNTIATGIWLKNNHAKAEDFLNAEKFPKIHFKSKSFKKTSAGFEVDGTLRIKDVAKQVQIPFSFDENSNKAVFKGDFEINRKDYNLDKSGIGEIIKIQIKLPVSH